MNKKTYQKPKMQIYPLMKHAPLLAGSGGGGPVVYIPRINEDLNELT